MPSLPPETETDAEPDAEPCFCTAVRQAARHLSQAYDGALAPLGISVNQFAVLARIERRGPRAIRDLAASLVMDRSTLGHLLRPLAARGLVDLAPAPGDRRRRLLALTPDGEVLLAAARPLWALAQRRFTDRYGQDAARRLHRMLGDVVALPITGGASARPDLSTS